MGGPELAARAPLLRPLELAAGFPLGPAGRLPEPADVVPPTALEGLEGAVLPALQRPPCLVAFSGGRDSSIVLATATRVARREGLSLPIPFSLRFPDLPDTDESSWQEMVVTSLGLDEWDRHDPGNDLDQLGPVAKAALRRHGLLWPYNSIFLTPALMAAGQGTVLTGADGDGLFDTWHWGRAAAVRAGRVRPRPRDAMALIRAAGPNALNRAWMAARHPVAPRWLQPDAAHRLNRAFGSEIAEEPRRWDRRVHWWSRRRYVALLVESLGRVASDTDAVLLNPLLDPGFLAGVASEGGRTGYRSRTEALHELFGALELPSELLKRRSKAGFDLVFWGPESRAFAHDWDGTGLDPELIDPDRLRQEWLKPVPDARSGLLLQAAWLSSETR